MNRRTRIIIAIIWLAAGVFNLYAYFTAQRTTNLVFTVLDFVLFVLYLIMGLRS